MKEVVYVRTERNSLEYQSQHNHLYFDSIFGVSVEETFTSETKNNIYIGLKKQ